MLFFELFCLLCFGLKICVDLRPIGVVVSKRRMNLSER